MYGVGVSESETIALRLVGLAAVYVRIVSGQDM
jgi:hypothetical protein